MIEARLSAQPEQPDGLEQPQRAERVGVSRIFRGFERDLDMALCAEVINLIRLDFLNNPDEISGIRQIAVVEEKILVRIVRVLIEMIDAFGVEQRRPPLDAVDFVPLGKEQFREIGAVLSGDSGYQGFFCGHWGSFMVIFILFGEEDIEMADRANEFGGLYDILFGKNCDSV